MDNPVVSVPSPEETLREFIRARIWARLGVVKTSALVLYDPDRWTSIVNNGYQLAMEARRVNPNLDPVERALEAILRVYGDYFGPVGYIPGVDQSRVFSIFGHPETQVIIHPSYAHTYGVPEAGWFIQGYDYPRGEVVLHCGEESRGFPLDPTVVIREKRANKRSMVK